MRLVFMFNGIFGEAQLDCRGVHYQGNSPVTRTDETTASVVAFYECTVIMQHNMR